jgi:hypothetical protein
MGSYQRLKALQTHPGGGFLAFHTPLRSWLFLSEGSVGVDTGLETNPEPRPASARWLLPLLAAVCVLVLLEGAWSSWSRAPIETRSVSQPSYPGHRLMGPAPARSRPGYDVDQSGRMPIRVSIQHAHVQVLCASDSQVPISIMQQAA